MANLVHVALFTDLHDQTHAVAATDTGAVIIQFSDDAEPLALTPKQAQALAEKLATAAVLAKPLTLFAH